MGQLLWPPLNRKQPGMLGIEYNRGYLKSWNCDCLNASSPTRLVYADVLRLFAILAVVFLHVSARALVKAHAFSAVWWAGNLFDSLSRWSVPVFVMISGALLLGTIRDESVSEFLNRRFRKILIPFFSWSGVYLVFRTTILHEHFDLMECGKYLSKEPAFYHLWFMYVILGLYLITPLLRVMLKQAQDADLRYFLSLWLLFACILPLSANLTGITLGIPMEFVTGYVGYFLLGHYLHQRPALPKSWLLSAFILGALLTLGGTWALTLKKHGFLDQVLFSYFSPNVVLMAIALYGWFQGQSFPTSWSGDSWVKQLSGCSFGIYLCHPLILALVLNTPIRQFRLETLLIQYWWGIPVCSCLIFLLSLALVLPMRKIPGLRTMVP